MFTSSEALRDIRAGAPIAFAVGGVSIAVLYVLVQLDEASRPLFNSTSVQLRAIGIIIALTVVACGRVRWAAATFVLTIVGTVALMLTIGDRSLGVSVLYWFAIITLAARVRGPSFVGLIVFGMVADLAMSVYLGTQAGNGAAVDHHLSGPAVVNVLISYGLFVAIGRFIAHTRHQKAHSMTALSRLEQEHQARINQAISDERRTMARELHDVAAHHLAGMIIQAKAANKIFVRDPEAARQMLPQIAENGEHTLTSLRQIVGILRLPTTEHLEPQPRIADIPSLVESCLRRGMTIRLTIGNISDEINSVVQLACYRIVQESLSNAERYASAADVAVEVTRQASKIRVAVANARCTETIGMSGQGFGIVGMQERCHLLGGSLTAGARSDGGWLVSAVIPLEGRITA